MHIFYLLFSNKINTLEPAHILIMYLLLMVMEYIVEYIHQLILEVVLFQCKHLMIFYKGLVNLIKQFYHRLYQIFKINIIRIELKLYFLYNSCSFISLIHFSIAFRLLLLLLLYFLIIKSPHNLINITPCSKCQQVHQLHIP